MRIGILTFHWATNYGAILQCLALQNYLEELGHKVEIINYKPRHFDFGWRYLLRPWLLRGIRKDLVNRKKELKLISFRSEYLHTSRRFYSLRDLNRAQLAYDVVISGSDQVLNPSFTISGENCPTSAYFLTFAPHSKRVGYAISFGCVYYPEKSSEYARRWINSFDVIGVRERTGIAVLDQLNYRGDKQIVPDPTILYGQKLFDSIPVSNPGIEDYLCVYFLRGALTIKSDNVVYIDELNNPVSMEDWLGIIIHSRAMITNSYHGMIMAILNHIPFVAIKEKADGSGMNDRFDTLLFFLGLQDRFIDFSDDYQKVLTKPIPWEIVDEKVAIISREGRLFLDRILQ